MTKWLPSELEKQIPRLRDTRPEENPIAWVRFFKASLGEWYVTEYDGQDCCYGLVLGKSLKFQYFSISKLNASRVIRDESFVPRPITAISSSLAAFSWMGEGIQLLEFIGKCKSIGSRHTKSPRAKEGD